MKRIFMGALSIMLLLTSCKDDTVIDKSDPMESGRGFIEASLKGDYARASKYLLTDSTNEQYLNGLRDFNKKNSPMERQNYRDANIVIDSTVATSDSVNVIYFYNTYKKIPQKLKVVKKGADWLVDFKYSFIDNPDVITQ